MRVGWIGTGVMGAPMAGHLLSRGMDVVVTTRTKARAQSLLDAGATWAETPAEAADEGMLRRALCVDALPHRQVR